MTRSFFAVILVTCLAFTSSVALQVAPNSQCSAVCIDVVGQDKSDPMQSNTVGSDIICRDQNYATPAGQKFRKCLDCLQNSSDKSTAESDLQWYLYNLRYAVSSCVFGLNTASDPLSSPCSIAASCGPLIGAIQDGMDKPTSDNKFSYCTAYGDTFLGSHYWPCTRCLQFTEEQKYMANFMVALRAGCTQKPEVGKIIGLDGTLFSKVPVNATTVTVAPTAVPAGQNKSGLTVGAYAGIGVAGAFVIAIFAAACLIGRRKTKARKERESLTSHIDHRFGGQNLNVPGHGGYDNHYSSKGPDHHSVGLVDVPSRGEKGLGLSSHDPNAHEQYIPKPQYHRPTSMISQHTINSRGPGVAMPYQPYQPSRNESPNPALYSPSGSTQPSDSPSHSPNSTTESNTHLRHPSYSYQETLNNTRANGQAQNERGGNRDRSVGRDGGDESHTSNPTVTLDSRFIEEDSASRKKQDRARLFRLGVGNK